MSLFQAFLYQVTIMIIILLLCYFQREDMPDSFWKIGIYYVIVIGFGLGTFVRWYYQVPLLGIGMG